MKNFLFQLGVAWRRFRNPAFVVIDRYGTATPRPQVHVSVCSSRGAIGVYTYDATAQGEAQATLNARDLSYIAGLKLVDRRNPPYEPDRV